MRRSAVLPLVALALAPLLAPPGLAVAQAVAPSAQAETDLADLLPGEGDVPAGLVAVEEGWRTAAAVAAGFPDPAEAARLLAGWGWEANAYRAFAAPGPVSAPRAAASLEVSLHRFAAAGAAQALDYFADGRIAALGVSERPAEPLGDQARAVGGAVDGGAEATVYARLGAVLVRVSAVGPVGSPSGVAKWVARAVAGNAYASPQFGFRVTWSGSWNADPPASVPGAHDHLRLAVAGGAVALEFRGVFTDQEAAAALREYGEERRRPHPGATSRLEPASAGAAGGGTPTTLHLDYAAADGAATTESVVAYPLVPGERVLFRVLVARADAEPAARDRLEGEVALDTGARSPVTPTPAPTGAASGDCAGAERWWAETLPRASDAKALVVRVAEGDPALTDAELDGYALALRGYAEAQGASDPPPAADGLNVALVLAFHLLAAAMETTAAYRFSGSPADQGTALVNILGALDALARADGLEPAFLDRCLSG